MRALASLRGGAVAHEMQLDAPVILIVGSKRPFRAARSS
jgi:hypothetical protein